MLSLPHTRCHHELAHKYMWPDLMVWTRPGESSVSLGSRRIQMAVHVIGLDTAKHVFQVHGADASGRAVLRKRLRRAQIPDFFANLPKCVVGIEATQGAHYWARV